jgi:hypothetical protein
MPHVHLRDDMEAWELDLFVRKYGAQAFNVHNFISDKLFKILKDPNYVKMVFVENCEEIDERFMNVLGEFAGICLDVVHWADIGLIYKNPSYANFEKLLEKHEIGCSHVSALTGKVDKCVHYITGKEYEFQSSHFIDDLSQLNYVKKYVNYLPKYVSIELENPFVEQLEAVEHLKKIINSK